MAMNFHYGIPHVWEQPRTTWEDVYLLPVDRNFDGPGIHLTVVALGDPEDESIREDREEILAKLGDREFVVDKEQADMHVRADDFSMPELLEWTRRFIEHIGIDCGLLVEAPPEFFRDRIEHAEIVASLVELEAERKKGTTS